MAAHSERRDAMEFINFIISIVAMAVQQDTDLGG
jgi:hypothetical protein